MSDIKTENRLVDTHTHITPNVDDGANSPEMSLEMLRSEAEQGGSAVIECCAACVELTEAGIERICAAAQGVRIIRTAECRLQLLQSCQECAGAGTDCLHARTELLHTAVH